MSENNAFYIKFAKKLSKTKYGEVKYCDKAVMEAICKNEFMLSDKAFDIFSYTVGLAVNCNGVCFPSLRKLAELFDTNETYVSRILRLLVKMGLLYIERLHLKGDRATWKNFYIIPTLEEILNAAKVALKGYDFLLEDMAKRIKDASDKMLAKAKEVVKKAVNVVKSCVKPVVAPTEEKVSTPVPVELPEEVIKDVQEVSSMFETWVNGEEDKEMRYDFITGEYVFV